MTVIDLDEPALTVSRTDDEIDRDWNRTAKSGANPPNESELTPRSGRSYFERLTMLGYILFFIVYICSFFWFKQSPWKRWLLWVAIIGFLGGGSPARMGAVTGILALWQVVRWTFILVITGIRKLADRQDHTWDKTAIYNDKKVASNVHPR